MRSRFEASRFDASLVGLQWALRLIIVAMAVLALAACNDEQGGPTDNDDAIASVEVTAMASTVEAGDSVLVQAAPKRADGTTRTDVTVNWLSTDTSVARVEGRAGQNAMVMTKKQGQVSIRAMVESRTGQAAINVVVTEQPAPAPVLTGIQPASAPEGSELIELTVTGQNFSELSLVRWNDVSIPTQFVSATELRGLITPANLAQVGTAEVTVRTGPPGGGTSAGRPFNILSRVATVHIAAPQKILFVGEETQLEATPRDQNGGELPRRATVWSSSDESVLTVNAQGVVVPVAKGFAEIRATVDGKVGSEGIYGVTAPIYDIMYDSNRGQGGRELWIFTPGSNQAPRRWLPEGVLAEDPAINATGTRIAFVCRDQYLNTDICVADRNGTGSTRLTTYEGADDEPAWSPDGSLIAYRSTQGNQSAIWIMKADGSGQRRLVGDAYDLGGGQQSKPTFGPNGRIYFQITYPEGRSVLASVPVSGSWQQMIDYTPAGYNDTDPQVSWSGHALIVRRKQGNQDFGYIYLDLNGQIMYSINYPGHGFGAAWSRNDQWIAYASSDDGQHPLNVYVTQPHDFWRKIITLGNAAGGGRNPIFIPR